MAIARSKAHPSLRTSAGARFTTTRLRGNSHPAATIADRTRSAASRTAAAASPTTLTAGRRRSRSTSTSMGMASTPCNVPPATLTAMFASRLAWGKIGATGGVHARIAAVTRSQRGQVLTGTSGLTVRIGRGGRNAGDRGVGCRRVSDSVGHLMSGADAFLESRHPLPYETPPLRGPAHEPAQPVGGPGTVAPAMRLRADLRGCREGHTLPSDHRAEALTRPSPPPNPPAYDKPPQAGAADPRTSVRSEHTLVGQRRVSPGHEAQATGRRRSEAPPCPSAPPCHQRGLGPGSGKEADDRAPVRCGPRPRSAALLDQRDGHARFVGDLREQRPEVWFVVDEAHAAHCDSRSAASTTASVAFVP